MLLADHQEKQTNNLNVRRGEEEEIESTKKQCFLTNTTTTTKKIMTTLLPERHPAREHQLFEDAHAEPQHPIPIPTRARWPPAPTSASCISCAYTQSMMASEIGKMAGTFKNRMSRLFGDRSGSRSLSKKYWTYFSARGR